MAKMPWLSACVALFAVSAIGGSIQSVPKAGASGKPAKGVRLTYSRDVAPILYARCTPCHRAGEVAPFRLEQYSDAKRWLRGIESAVRDRRMPPWKAVPGHGDFIGSRLLQDGEREMILNWIKSGAAPGDLSKAPRAPGFSAGWQLGKPDLVLEMPAAFSLPADGPDVLRNFVLPTDLGDDKVVAALEFRPGNPKVVHHALVFLDSNRAARALDAKDSELGYTSFGGPGFFPTGSLGGWAPGGSSQYLPDGIGRYFQKGSDVVLQVHYHPSGKPEKDRSKIGIYFAKKPVTRLVGGIALENWDIAIPPGEKVYRRTASYVLPLDTTLLSVTPHMHLLGRELKVWALLPDGTRKSLVLVKDWDFQWQDTFLYREPVRLPRGTRLEMETVHDNSTSNPRNPQAKPAVVKYGEGSLDEMSLCIFEVTCDRIEDLLSLIADDGRHRKVLERAIELASKTGKG